MPSPTAWNGQGPSGSPGTSGPSPAGVAGLVHDRIVMLAGSYERAADELLALAAELPAAEAPEWKGPAARAYRVRLDALTADLRSVAHGYHQAAAELRAGAAGLAAQIGAVEQFLDLGALGTSVVGVLAQTGLSAPTHVPAGSFG